MRGIASATGAVAGDVIVLLGCEATLAPQGASSSTKPRAGSGWSWRERLELIKPGTWNFLWVVDFPMFDYDEREKRFAAMHHPFTSPREEDLEKLETDPGAVKALGLRPGVERLGNWRRLDPYPPARIFSGGCSASWA